MTVHECIFTSDLTAGARRQNGTNNLVIDIRHLASVTFHIEGATAAEIDAMVEAINAPILRQRGEQFAQAAE